jgi:hypothetical protein
MTLGNWSLFLKLASRHARLPDDRAKRSRFQFFVVGNGHRGRATIVVVTTHYDVAATLPDLGEAMPLKNGADFLA